MELSASRPVPADEEEDIEKAEPENTPALDDLAKGSDYSKLLLTSFINMDPSMILTLKLKQMVEKDWYHIEIFLEK